MKLHLGKRAARQAERLDTWWTENRPHARDLFAYELRDTLRLLQGTPRAGTPWPTARRPTLRRILMPRTQNHIYYRLDETKKAIVVLAVWGSPRKRPPKL